MKNKPEKQINNCDECVAADFLLMGHLKNVSRIFAQMPNCTCLCPAVVNTPCLQFISSRS
jgi:hypothetical protein